MAYKIDHLILDSKTMTLIDSETGQLISQDVKLIAALDLLAARYPNAVTKNELMAAIWPKQFLSEWSLSRLISDTRNLLGSRHHIQTVHGRGYRYNFPVVEVTRYESPKEEPPIPESTAQEAPSPESFAQESSRLELSSSDTGPSKEITSGKIHPFVIYGLFFLAVSCCLLILYWTNSSFLNQQQPVIAVLPADIEDGHPAWRLGMPAFISTQMSGLPIAITHPRLVTRQLNLWRQQYPNQTLNSKNLKTFCTELGCNQLVLIHQTLNHNRILLNYQLITPDTDLMSPTFSGENLHQAMESVWKNLRTHFAKNKKPIFELATDTDAAEFYIEALGYLAKDDAPPAKMILASLLKRRPDFAMGKLALAQLAAEMNPEASKNWLEQLNTQDPYLLFVASILQTQILLAESKPDLAEQSAAQAIKLSTQLTSEHVSAVALINTGMVNMALNRSALEEFEQAKNIFSNHQDAYALAITNLCMADAIDLTKDRAGQANNLRDEAQDFLNRLQFPMMTCSPKTLLY